VSITYADACADPNLFGPWFEGPSWDTWRVMDKALFGLPLAKPELKIFHEIAGDREPPSERVTEGWLFFGRRSAKTLKSASLGVYQATIGAELFGYRKRLQRGERGVVQILAVDRDQARVCFNYAKAFFEQPMLAALLAKPPTADTIELTNSISIEITTNDRRRVRGRTVVCAILDEVCHWRDEASVSPDEDVYQSIKPAMATVPGAQLFAISSVYARRGLGWRKFNQSHGKPGSVLVAKAPTWVVNPLLPRDCKVIADEYEKDPAWAAGEYGSEWRDDIESYITLDAVRAGIVSDVRECLPERRNRYVAFVDAAGGAGQDSYTLAIAHREGDTVILDCLREARPPFSPEVVTEEYADLVKKYRITKVWGDHFGGEMPRELWRRHGLNYERASKSKSELYIDFLPLLNSGACDLLDHDRLINQLVALERQRTRGGRDRIDHPRGAHDDLANVAAGAIVFAMQGKGARDARTKRIPVVEGVSGRSGAYHPLAF
jgi:hypothetical protein